MLFAVQQGFNDAAAAAFDLLAVPEPITAVEWADKHFYLPEGTAHIPGRWTTLHFQIAILNAMCNDAIAQVDVMKSARVGYTKLLLATICYNVVHRSRNQAIWQSTDGDIEEFVKEEIDPLFRFIPSLRKKFPWHGKKAKENTLKLKKFLGCSIFFRGAQSAKNFRRFGVQVALIDEIDSFPLDVDGEGSASTLAWKRTEGAPHRKMIRGSSPKLKFTSQIEDAVKSADAYFKYFIDCPACGHGQELKFGGKSKEYGLKWFDSDPNTAAYQCESCHDFIIQRDFQKSALKTGAWIYEHREDYDDDDPEAELPPVLYRIKTVDGLLFTKDGTAIDPPEHVAFHVWTILSPYVSWSDIIKEWIKAQRNPLELKSFVNTTLGETFDTSIGEKINKHELSKRVETYPDNHVPHGVCLVTCGVDVQGDRFEVQHIGWGPGLEGWVLKYQIIECDTSLQSSWDDYLDPAIENEFITDNNISLFAEATGVDTGYNAQNAYKFCLKNEKKKYLALKGRGGEIPIIPLEPKKTWNKAPKGMKGWICGVDTAKTVIMHMIARDEPGEGYLHFPDKGLPEDYFEQLTSERRLLKVNNATNSKAYSWHLPASKRNEALDTTVYNLAPLEHLNINLDVRYSDIYGIENGPGGDAWAAFDKALE